MTHQRGLLRGYRDPRLRGIHEAALQAGWTAHLQGNGHVRLTSPSGTSITLSTSAQGTYGRVYQNTRAAARRAGLEIA